MTKKIVLYSLVIFCAVVVEVPLLSSSEPDPFRFETATLSGPGKTPEFSKTLVLEDGEPDTIEAIDRNRYFELNPSLESEELKKANEELEKKRARHLERQYFTVAQSLSTLTAGNTVAAVSTVAKSAIDVWWARRAGRLPGWAKRIELNWQLREDSGFEFEALTVQPLYQSEDKVNTFFTQISVVRYEQIQDYRTATNLGLGYRRLLADDKALVGVNTFFDREWDNDHHRIGSGIEARWNALDLYANYYLALTDGRKIVDDTYEQALDGWDVEMTSQVPYLPWLRLRGKGFFWNTETAVDNIEGWSTSVEMDVTRFLLVEMGVSDDNFNDREFFVNLRITLDHDRPTMVSNLVDKKPFRPRDMKGHTLDRVRRENKFITERSFPSGVVVARGT